MAFYCMSRKERRSELKIRKILDYSVTFSVISIKSMFNITYLIRTEVFSIVSIRYFSTKSPCSRPFFLQIARKMTKMSLLKIIRNGPRTF